MTRFGILCPAAIGHLNPMCVLGRELQQRGHSTVLFGIPDLQQKIEQTGIEFHLIGRTDFPEGTLPIIHQKLGELSGLEGFKFTVNWLQSEIQMLFNDAVDAIREERVDVLIVDQTTLCGGTIADFLKLPFVTVCNALLIHQESGVPPFFTGWGYSTSWWSHLRNRIGNGFLFAITQSVRKQVQLQRQQWHLPPYASDEHFFSTLAQICQLPAEFDFPRKNLPTSFHYTGPLQDSSGQEPISLAKSPFPFDRLTDRPLIYASLGTLQNRKSEIFQIVAAACVGLDAQLVISLGNAEADISSLIFQGSPIVVPYAPHQQIIQRARLIITHAGMNTTLGALSSGVPLIAVPITNEQPAIAARIARTGAGEVVKLSELNIDKLKIVIQQVLSQDSYKINAARLQTAIVRAGGVKRAAYIIEHVISSASSELLV
ncbi:glycosyltransferase [Altericista sp. CCNU0014]|uniref:glycosyltransferase n=1 Tax=Altericista sp. CCNU0014 TaxID=3082949 RepID=UPI00384BD0FB